MSRHARPTLAAGLVSVLLLVSCDGGATDPGSTVQDAGSSSAAPAQDDDTAIVDLPPADLAAIGAAVPMPSGTTFVRVVASARLADQSARAVSVQGYAQLLHELFVTQELRHLAGAGPDGVVPGFEDLLGYGPRDVVGAFVLGSDGGTVHGVLLDEGVDSTAALVEAGVAADNGASVQLTRPCPAPVTRLCLTSLAGADDVVLQSSRVALLEAAAGEEPVEEIVRLLDRADELGGLVATVQVAVDTALTNPYRDPEARRLVAERYGLDKELPRWKLAATVDTPGGRLVLLRYPSDDGAARAASLLPLALASDDVGLPSVAVRADGVDVTVGPLPPEAGVTLSRVLFSDLLMEPAR